MFLTFFVMIATWLKAWQLRSIRTKLLEHISADSCVVFYKVPEDVEECSRACSSLCVAPKEAHISEILEVNGAACACSLRPTPRLCLSSWRAPPLSPARLALLPNVGRTSMKLLECGNHPGTSTASEFEEVSVLLECNLGGDHSEEINILPESEPWKVLAWRVAGSHLALALRGDIPSLALLASSFMSYEGPLERLQTVTFEGAPIPLTEQESVTVSRATVHGSPRHRARFISTLENITKNIPIEPSPVDQAPKQNQTNHTKEINIVIHSDSIESVTNSIIIEPKQEAIINTQNVTSSIDSSKPKSEGNGDIIEEMKVTPLSSRKSDLKLELNNKSMPDKSQPKTVTISSKSKTTVSHKKTVTKTMGKKASSRSSLLDEPIAAAEKSNRGGASCPTLPIVRPPNVLVYSDSAVTRENIARSLKSVLDSDRYAVYCTGDESSLEATGPGGSALLVAGGALPPRASAALLNALLGGAQVLSLCSDLLLTVLPYYRTAEVRERELVSFTYEKWRSVKLLHHVFCYQASPARRQFSATPATHPTEYKGHGNHVLRVEVLAAEQTWHTPSLLKAVDDNSGGTAIFSQVHLELDAREYLSSDGSAAETARLGVLRKLLSALGLTTAASPLNSTLNTDTLYTPAYFLGTYERKLEVAESVAVGRLQLIQPKEKPPAATETLTPLLLHACPDHFSTLDYFQELRTNHLGRLVIYSEVLSSTQEILKEQSRAHGLVVIADRQTKGLGRGGNVWLSPAGCLMFSVEIQTSLSEGHIASRASLMQHMVAVAIVSAIRDMPGCKDLDLRIKWPNDIFYSRSVKLGGLLLNTSITGDQMIFNVGIGINLDNAAPTKCLNEVMKMYNSQLPPMQREKLLAIILNRLEEIYDAIQKTGNFTELYDLYYKYWLHTDEEVAIIQEGVNGNEPLSCQIVGLDESGYLVASGPNGDITLRPDGNTFDMMRGLIAPKPST